MTCKVVILNWNGAHHLRQFLPSVVHHTPASLAGVVVADNGSTDDSLAVLRAEFPSVRVVELPENYGFAEGYNRALALVEADVYVLLNSDVEVTAGWLEPLLATLKNDGKLAAVAPKLLSFSDKTHFEYAGASGGFIDALGYPFCRGRILDTLETDAGQYDDAREVFWASGAAMAVRAEVFRALGGLDGSFFAHMEEIDFCWRAQLRGWRVGVVPSSEVWHLGGGMLPNDSPRKVYLNFRNNLAMLYKCLPKWHLWPILATRTMLDGVSAGLFLLQGKPSFCSSVWRAHRDFRRQLPVLRQKRREVQNSAKHRPHGIFRGSILIRYYLLRRKKFGKLL